MRDESSMLREVAFDPRRLDEYLDQIERMDPKKLKEYEEATGIALAKSSLDFSDFQRSNVQIEERRLMPRYVEQHFISIAGEMGLKVEAPRKLLQSSDFNICRYEICVGIHSASGENSLFAEKLLLTTMAEEEPIQRQLFPPSPEHPPQTILRKTHAKGVKTVINKVSGGNDNFYDETGKGWDHAFKLGPRKSALVVLDYEGSGQEGRPPDDVRNDLKRRLETSGWADRTEVLVLCPELENWVWSDSPEIDQAIRVAGPQTPVAGLAHGARMVAAGDCQTEPTQRMPRSCLAGGADAAFLSHLSPVGRKGGSDEVLG